MKKLPSIERLSRGLIAEPVTYDERANRYLTREDILGRIAREDEAMNNLATIILLCAIIGVCISWALLVVLR